MSLAQHLGLNMRILKESIHPQPMLHSDEKPLGDLMGGLHALAGHPSVSEIGNIDKQSGTHSVLQGHLPPSVIQSMRESSKLSQSYRSTHRPHEALNSQRSAGHKSEIPHPDSTIEQAPQLAD